MHAARCVALSVVLLSAQDCWGELSARDQNVLVQRVAPAYHGGNGLDVLKSLSPLYKKWSHDQLTAADTELKKWGAPSCIELLTNGRLHLYKNGQRAPKPSWREAMDVAMSLMRVVDQREARLMNHPALRKPVISPSSFGEYRRFLEDLQLLRLQSQDTRSRTGLAKQLIAPLTSRRWLTKWTPEQLAATRRDYAGLRAEYEAMVATLDIAILQLRVNQVLDAEAVLRLSGDAAERLMAALVVDIDGPRVLRELKTAAGAGKHALAAPATLLSDDPGLIGQMETALTQTKAPPDLVSKARRLEEAVQWWLRGRYALGPLANGLLKLPGAATDLQPHLALRMPVAAMHVTREDESGADVSYATTYPRRHHYVWRKPDRDVVFVETAVDYGETILQESIVGAQERTLSICGTEILLERSILRYEYLDTVLTQSRGVIADDPTDVYQWVGFVEYGNYLRHMDSLLPQLSPGEVEAVEEVVLGDDRLAFETNLSRHLRGDLGPLNEKPAAPGDNFQRHGLDWMLALARVEQAAMLAAYTDLAQPFIFVRPTKYEAKAYRELLLDGFRTHYLALPPDHAWQGPRQAGGRQMLINQRRLSLVARFGGAVDFAKLAPAERPVFGQMASRVQQLKNQLERGLLLHMRPRMSNEIVGSEVRTRRQNGATRVTHDP